MRFLNHSRLVCSLLAGLGAASAVSAMTPAELSARLGRNERLLLVDVRPATAYTEGHIPGAINIPLSLLPHKQVPAGQLVVLCGDGLGVVDEAKALAALRAKPGLTADVLEGGYAAWLAEVRVSTAAPGVTAEKVPGITYDQLVAAGKADMVLVDLRAPAPAAATVRAASRERPATAASLAPDVLDDFSKKIGVPVVAPSAQPAVAALRSASVESVPAPATARAAQAAASLDKTGKLLVLVADNESDANEAARQLRARGNYRFTVLIGGTEAIRHEGKTGSGRMDGGLPVTPSQK